MPLDKVVSDAVIAYCEKDLPSHEKVAKMFEFIEDSKLRHQIEAEFHAGRYIYKLGQGLSVKNERLRAHVKFQIVQYAAIYEAIIVHLLWGRYKDHDEVKKIETKTAHTASVSLPRNLKLMTDKGQEVFLHVRTEKEANTQSIKFDDKIKASVAIGFLSKELGEEIKTFYKLRNGIHLESAIKNEVEYEIDNSRAAYRRMSPFTQGIKGFLRDGVLPESTKLKKAKRQLLK
jgi:hypothetical protein